MCNGKPWVTERGPANAYLEFWKAETENREKAIFIKIMVENSPELMKTRHPRMQTEKNLKQYVKKTNPYLDIRRNRRTEHKEKKEFGKDSLSTKD